LFELYCEDPRCRCRKVLIKIVGKEQGWVASIDHSLTDFAACEIDEPQTVLDPHSPPGPFSEGFLALARQALSDPTYAERLERHYRLIKNRHLGGFTDRHPTTQLKRKLLRKVGRC
jgi:hypothetical protein